MKKYEQEGIPILSDCDLIDRLGPDAITAFNEKQCVDKIISSAIKTLRWQAQVYCSVKYEDYILGFGDDILTIDFYNDYENGRFFRFRFINKWWHIEEFSDLAFILSNQSIPVSSKCNELLCLLECVLSSKIISNFNRTLFIE